MRVFVQSEFPCDGERAWEAVQTSALLREICWPLVRLAPGSGAKEIPARWSADSTAHLRAYVFGFIPIGTRVLHWESIDSSKMEMQTREHDPLIRRWDHRIHVEPIAAGRCRYTDDVEINAGVLTFGVWLFAQWFYRHRQHRWKRVAKRLQNGAT